MKPTRLARATLFTLVVAALAAFGGWTLTAGSGATPVRMSDGQVEPALPPAADASERDAAQQALEAAKSAYRFAEWPGKNGLLRPGLNLGPILANCIPSVELAWVHRPAGEKSGMPLDVVDVLWFSPDPENNYEIRLWVASSCVDAQEVLLRRLAWRQSPAIEPRGSEMGVELGDLSFPGSVGGSKSVAFVRNNVVVEVKAPTGDALDIGRLIDQGLLARPTFNSYEAMASYRPEIRRFHLKGHPAEPLHVEGYAGHSKRFPLEFEVVDPQGGQLVLSWEGSPGISVLPPETKQPHTHEVSAEIWGPESEIQHRELTLTAVNECGMFSRATIPIQVRVLKKERQIRPSE